MDLKRRIIVYMGELDHVPETSFEKDVVCEDEDSFCLSGDNIMSLKLLVSQVRRRKQRGGDLEDTAPVHVSQD